MTKTELLENVTRCTADYDLDDKRFYEIKNSAIDDAEKISASGEYDVSGYTIMVDSVQRNIYNYAVRDSIMKTIEILIDMGFIPTTQ